MAEIHGKGAIVYLGSATGAAAINLAEQVSWSIDFAADFVETTPLNTLWKQQVKGLMAWTGAFEGNFDTASTALFAASTDTGVENFYLYPQGSSSTYYFGTAWVKLGKVAAGSTTSKASSSFTLIGYGALSQH